jgi:hypothetical protein
MSNVIDFSEARRKRTGYPGPDSASLASSSDSSVTATLLFENLDDPQLALAKATLVVARMPDGFARDCAIDDLERLRVRLSPALGGELRDTGPDAA